MNIIGKTAGDQSFHVSARGKRNRWRLRIAANILE
jgi:hypothetical protein